MARPFSSWRITPGACIPWGQLFVSTLTQEEKDIFYSVLCWRSCSTEASLWKPSAKLFSHLRTESIKQRKSLHAGSHENESFSLNAFVLKVIREKETSRIRYSSLLSLVWKKKQHNLNSMHTACQIFHAFIRKYALACLNETEEIMEPEPRLDKYFFRDLTNLAVLCLISEKRLF